MLIIEFTTDLFNSTESKPHFINERCFGEDLIEWLKGEFDDPRFNLDQPFQEDWGWAMLARINGETLLVGVGIQDESIGEVPARWMLMIDKMRRFWIFGTKKSTNIAVLADKFEYILNAESQITEVERYEEDQRGRTL